MRKIKKRSVPRIRRRVAAMLELHARSLHLPHIRRYHAARKQSRTGAQHRRVAAGVKTKCVLPAYLLAPSSANVDLKNARRIGQVEFFIWNDALPVISEIDRDSRVFSVASGATVATQHRIVQRLLSNKLINNLSILSVPALHFRGVMFTQKKSGRQVIVPLRSPVVHLTPGKSYLTDVVQRQFGTALTNRMNAPKHLKSALSKKRGRKPQ